MTARIARNKRYVLLICAGLALGTVIAYEHLYHGDFVDYDDDMYVTENPHVKNGITGDSISWAFTTGHAYNWHPLTWLSHMLDCQLFGSRPGWHHLTNLLLHIVNTLLLFGVLKRITGALWASGFVAAAFALHPLHVESVAWISERKDVLGTLFWLLTMAAYVRYVRRPGLSRYLLTVLCFALGLMAKPMLVTLPFVLLLLDYWPLGRLQLEQATKDAEPQGGKSANISSQWQAFRRLVWEKVPFLALAAISSIVTFCVQRSGGTVVQTGMLSLDVRMANALVSYLRYIKKMIYPSQLAVFYPYRSLSLLLAIACFAILVFITVAVVYLGRRRRYLLVGWFWYVGTLVPVIGIVQVGSQSIADRYTYVPLIGLFIIIAWGAGDVSARWRYQKIVLGICSAIALTGLLISTQMQVRHWQNSFTLFEHTLAVTEDNSITHNHYGAFLLEQGRFGKALAQFNEALRISPGFHEAHKNKGSVLLDMGKFDEAIATFNELLLAAPDWPDAHYWLGVAYARRGAYQQAVKPFKEALRLRPDWPEAYNDLALVYLLLGNYDLAIENYKEALRLRPDYPQAVNNLKIAIAKQRQLNETQKIQEKVP
ncbi:MAG: tetratricopeptide repeat protein [Planctomycetota bacterium]|nr:MAG: tetratricopeptide repeat protein [Planctomycetota bacterium]